MLFRNDVTSRQSSASTFDLPPPRSKTSSTGSAIADVESQPVANNASLSTGFHFLQSIKDLTQQELNRANPLGLLGKEVISATGTTHCPEPVPPREKDDASGPNTRSSSTGNEDEPQQLHFVLNDDEKMEMRRRRSTLLPPTETHLPPCPAEYIPTDNDIDVQPRLFSQPSPTTMMADFIPDTMTINVFEVFIYAWGVFAFFFDMFTDLVLAHAYYLEGAFWLFILTLMCVILPNLTLSVFSLVWYIDSSQLKAAANEQTNTACDPSPRTSSYQTEGLVENGQDQVDAHISRNRHQPVEPEPRTKRKTFHLSAATAGVMTWIIRIIILVLQLDLCLK